MNHIKRFVAEDCGAEIVEYALVLALAVIGSAAAISSIWGSVTNFYTSATAAFAP